MRKTSPEKATFPSRKSILRAGDQAYEKDIITPFDPGAIDLLMPFTSAESMETIQGRPSRELSALPQAVTATRNPAEYRVEFLGFPAAYP